MKINFADFIAPVFDDVFNDIQEHSHTHYWLKGGRGGLKSSFVGLNLPTLLMQNPNCHAVVLRKVANTLRTSVYNQVVWAIELMGIRDLFDCRVSPLCITYKPTGQKILFLGVDDKGKIKSLKLPFGYVGLVWYEELDQFDGMEEIRNLNQSLLRGGSDYWCFYTFNPPKSKDNWTNLELLIPDPDRLVKHTSYLDVPKDWLGEQFFLEAEKLKNTRELLYRHEYLGEVIGIGGNIFDNVTLREITDNDIKTFGQLSRGLDWGFARDPFCYLEMYYDEMRQKLYLLDEIFGLRINNRQAAEKIKKLNPYNQPVFCDSAESKSVSDLQEYGVCALEVAKGPGSVERGMRFLTDEIVEIVIDPKRTPNAAREFSAYEYKQDKNGNFISAYPDKDNHSIDAARYALRDAIDRMNHKKLTLSINY